MTTQTLESVLAEHPFCNGLAPQDLRLLTGCAKNVVFPAGKAIAHEGDAADSFYLIREGRIAVETYVPERGQVVIQTVAGGDTLGWSWLVPPHAWRFDIRAVQQTRAVALDGKCLRGKCDDDPRFGYAMLQRVAQVFVERLAATRLQLLDVYGHRS